MKKNKSQIQLIMQNEATGHAVVMVPMALVADLKELLNEDELDYQVALKRHRNPKRQLILGNQLRKELGL